MGFFVISLSGCWDRKGIVEWPTTESLHPNLFENKSASNCFHSSVRKVEMAKHWILGIGLLLMLLTGMAAHRVLTWKIGESYAVRFETEKVSGAFTQLSGRIEFDENDLSASLFDVAVATASIETGIGLKNKHARSENWFDAEKYPEIRFQSISIRRHQKAFETRGTLDLHGVQKEIVIPFTFVQDTFKGDFSLNRLDYHLGATEGMQGSVGKELTVSLSVPVRR
jgi:polyisoprenoid-binding protein YceI